MRKSKSEFFHKTITQHNKIEKLKPCNGGVKCSTYIYIYLAMESVENCVQAIKDHFHASVTFGYREAIF